MKLTKLFWINPYLTECTASVTSVNGNVITVDNTVAYAFEGGQMSDSGTIGGYEIIEAVRDGKQIYYTLPENSLKAGDEATIKIDWEKRYKIMKLHFAAELVLETVYQQFGHPEKIGANITDEKARVDFIWNGNIAEIFPTLEPVIDKMIKDDLEITSRFEDEESERRVWEIEGFAKVPCGGTHIRRTSEIGGVKLKRVNPGKGKERIEITLA